jgi:hypothetical protein
MTISFTQQGIVSQLEFAKLLTLGSTGALEAAAPFTDDERRDFEIHRKGDFDRSIAFQVKSSRNFVRMGRRQELSIHFPVRQERVVNHPRFWYFFAYLDVGRMAFSDPVFLVPSAIVHRHGSGPANKRQFSFEASMSPKSRDQWVPYRVSTIEVGHKVLEIIAAFPRRLQASGPPTGLAKLPDLVWASRRRAA